MTIFLLEKCRSLVRFCPHRVSVTRGDPQSDIRRPKNDTPTPKKWHLTHFFGVLHPSTQSRVAVHSLDTTPKMTPIHPQKVLYSSTECRPTFRSLDTTQKVTLFLPSHPAPTHPLLKIPSLIGPVTSKPDVDRFDCEQNSAIIILFIQSEVGDVEFLFCRAAVLSSSQGNTFWRGRYGSCSHESTSTPERIKE